MVLLDAGDARNADLIGEDTAELFAVIENSFGISLGDYSQLNGTTIRELAEIIDKKANFPTPDRCLSSVVFYQLRLAFVGGNASAWNTNYDAQKHSDPARKGQARESQARFFFQRPPMPLANPPVQQCVQRRGLTRLSRPALQEESRPL
jgi:hypothetical protein